MPRRSKVQGEESLVVLSPGQEIRDLAREERSPGGVRGKNPLGGGAPVAERYDPDDLPLTKAVEEHRRRIRSCEVDRQRMYDLCAALKLTGLKIRRFQQEGIRLGKHLPAWRAELAELEAAQVDCEGKGYLEKEYLGVMRSIRFGTKPPGAQQPVGDMHSAGEAVYQKWFRLRRARQLAALPMEPAVTPRRFTGREDAEVYLAEEKVVALMQLRDFAENLDERGASAKERTRARAAIRKVVGDMIAMGMDTELLGRYGRMPGNHTGMGKR